MARPHRMIFRVAVALGLLVLTQCSNVNTSAGANGGTQQGNFEHVKFGFPF
jgi:hypothetical protein